MQSDKIKNTEEKAEKTEVCEVTSEYKKQRFGLKIFPETLEIVDTLFKHDNCKSRSEFIAPQLTAMAEGIVKGTEQRLSRALFKIAVELGAVTHMLAAVHEIDDDTMIKLRAMCIDEVKRINGVINFEKAVRYQRLD